MTKNKTISEFLLGKSHVAASGGDIIITQQKKSSPLVNSLGRAITALAWLLKLSKFCKDSMLTMITH